MTLFPKSLLKAKYAFLTITNFGKTISSLEKPANACMSFNMGILILSRFGHIKKIYSEMILN